MILGIDEVGRGPWAGPLVVGAVVLNGLHIDGLTDSKKLSAPKRQKIDLQLRSAGVSIGLGWVFPEELDTIGLSEALKRATKRAVEQINVPYHEIIIDGTVNFLKDTVKAEFVTTLKKADMLIPSVSAASIVAKVARDEYMRQQDNMFPGYGFAQHMGYGTEFHRAAIESHGVTPLHRLSIVPLRKYRHTIQNIEVSIDVNMTNTTSIGNVAEEVAALYLRKKGHVITERNWKTKLCEVDIISTFKNTVYFSEVKYRKSAEQGGGTAAITPKKQKQMGFAAELYVLKHKVNSDLCLTVISVTGQPPAVESYYELI